MKKILLFTLVLVFNYNCLSSQNVGHSERIHVIANAVDNSYALADYDVSNLLIKSKISWILELKSEDFELINPTLVNELDKGWYLQYEFHTPLYAGIYKEELVVINDTLVITESRNAMMAIASNCNTIVFADTQDHCKCTSKKDASLESVLTYRLFNSTP